VSIPQVNVRNLSEAVQTAEYVNILSQIFQVASNLKDFTMSFGCIEKADTLMFEKSCVFFKQMVRTMPMPHFRRLALSHLITRKKYLKNMLRSCKTTLEALTLSCITFVAIADESSVEDILMESLKLKDVTFERINCTWHGFCFGRVNQLRPESCVMSTRSPLDDEAWVFVTKGEDYDDIITLKADEGDDVKYWLSEISKKIQWGEAWTWEDLKYNER
jgi:hypothetical protein